MNDIQIFNNPEFGEIRTIEVNNEPYFVGNDVAKALGYSNPQKAVRDHVDEDDRTNRSVTDALGRKQDTAIINESGLYSLILSSKLEGAKKFKRWVTSEVLPSIRKNGRYDVAVPKSFAEALRLAAEQQEKIEALETENQKQLALISEKDEKIDEQTKQIEVMEKKVSYLDTILASKDTVTITQIAQDYGKSAVTFNQILKENGVQYKVNDQWILYADYKDQGYVQSHTVEYNDKQGNTHTKLNTRWTQKGRVFLYEFLKKIGILPKIEQ